MNDAFNMGVDDKSERGRTYRSRRKQDTSAIEEANAKSDAEFAAAYLPSLYVQRMLSHPALSACFMDLSFS